MTAACSVPLVLLTATWSSQESQAPLVTHRSLTSHTASPHGITHLSSSSCCLLLLEDLPSLPLPMADK